MGTGVYEQVYFYVDGQLDGENTGFKLMLEGDDQPVLTIPKPFAGITPSPKMTRAQVKDVIPPTGMVFDAFESFLLSTVHEFRAVSAATGKSYTFMGFAQKPSIDAAVGKTVDYDYELIGEASKWQ